MSINKKLICFDKQSEEFFSCLSKDSDIIVISPNNIYDNFISSDVFYDTKISDSFIDMFSAKKLVVEASHKIDKIGLSNIIKLAEDRGIDVDFYAVKVDSTGFLYDSVEYLVINCQSMSIFPL